jgi:hypothetical protein
LDNYDVLTQYKTIGFAFIAFFSISVTYSSNALVHWIFYYRTPCINGTISLDVLAQVFSRTFNLYRSNLDNYELNTQYKIREFMFLVVISVSISTLFQVITRTIFGSRTTPTQVISWTVFLYFMAQMFPGLF